MPLPPHLKARLRILLAATALLCGCRVLSAWHSVISFIVATVTIGVLVIVLFVRGSPWRRRFLFLTLFPPAVLWNAVVLANGSFVVLLGAEGLLEGRETSLAAVCGWEFMCVPLAAAANLAALARSSGRAVRTLRWVAGLFDVTMAGYGFWLWHAWQSAGEPVNLPPTVTLVALAGCSLLVLVLDAVPPATTAGPGLARKRPSLRTLAVVATTTLVCGGLALGFKPMLDRGRTASALEQLPVRVDYWQAAPRASWFPRECQDDVVAVHVADAAAFSKVDCARLGELLGSLTRVVRVDIRRLPSGGTAALAHLGDLPNLDQLALDGDGVTDDALAKIGTCVQLRVLSLANSRLTDDGLVHLGRLAKLQTLALDEALVTDEVIASLRKLPKLRHVDLRLQPDLSDEGQDKLKKLWRALPRCLVVGVPAW